MSETPIGGGGANIVTLVVAVILVFSLLAMVDISGRFTGPALGAPKLMLSPVVHSQT